MSNIYLISDTHFGQNSILSFKKEDGSVLRDFSSIVDHDNYLIDKWNSVVKQTDKIYHLGDVGFKNWTTIHGIFKKLNGEKILIKGNHDKFKLSQYQQIFKDIRAYKELDNFLLSHIPIHPNSLSRWKANIHGHLHANSYEDPRYINVSVEQLDDYTPISLEDLKKKYGY